MSTVIVMREVEDSLDSVARRAASGESFIVVRNDKPAFRIVPYNLKPGSPTTSLKDMRKRLVAANVEKLSSRQIDQIIHQARALTR